jgi:hypothetical protein
LTVVVLNMDQRSSEPQKSKMSTRIIFIGFIALTIFELATGQTKVALMGIAGSLTAFAVWGVLRLIQWRRDRVS